MFTEYFDHEHRQPLMPGVDIKIFDGAQQTGDVPLCMDPGHVEAIFCTEGAAVFKRTNGVETKLGPREILLLSDCGGLESACISSAMHGICIHVDTANAGESFMSLCRDLGNLPLSTRKVGEIMRSSGGVRVLPVTPWSRSVFYTLKAIPQSAWGHYSTLKLFELMYLMCTQNMGSDAQAEQTDSNSYLAGIAESMRAYMEEHLDEKLTILDLSRRFHLSRTACKSCFRACFGQPIHSWILDRRMEQATDLLEHTNMPVLQIAQSVGYSGVSQFNAAFKQRYGKTPREYRKMSVSSYS